MSGAETVDRSLDFDLADLKALGPELNSRLAAIRECEPVFWSGLQQAWFITRYDDVVDGFVGKLPLSSERIGQVAFASIPQDEWGVRIPLLTNAIQAFANMTDPPRHTYLRKRMNGAFMPKNVEKIRPFVQRRVLELLDEAEAKREFEFIAQIARPLTGTVIMALMGMPESVLGELRDWANAVVQAAGTPKPSPETLERGEAALRQMDALFEQELDKRRKAPTDDLLSTLIQESPSLAPLTSAELLGTCVNTLLAGHESTASTMAFGTAALANDAHQVAVMLANPSRIGDALAEIGRFVGMSASQTRIAKDDFEWHGKQIKAGDIVYLWIAAACRDPRVFASPDAFDIERDAVKSSVVFGGGIHFCVGHLLAKLELGEFFPAMFQRFRVEITDDALDFSGGFAFRTLSTMNVRVSPLGEAG